MPRPLRFLAACGVALLAATTMSAGQQTPPRRTSGRSQPVAFTGGETLVYDVSWSNLLTAGSATIRVVDKRTDSGAAAYYITAEGRPTGFIAALYPIYYKADTLLESRTLLPHRSSIYSDEKGKRRYRIVTFDRKTGTLRYEVQSGDPLRVTSQQNDKLPLQAQDALSAIFGLRAAALAVGTKLTMPIVVNGHVYRVEMAVTGRDTVQCGLGRVDAWRITPTLLDARDRNDGRDMAIWISTDTRRLPVKLQGALAVGTFTLTLTGA